VCSRRFGLGVDVRTGSGPRAYAGPGGGPLGGTGPERGDRDGPATVPARWG